MSGAGFDEGNSDSQDVMAYDLGAANLGEAPFQVMSKATSSVSLSNVPDVVREEHVSF